MMEGKHDKNYLLLIESCAHLDQNQRGGVTSLLGFILSNVYPYSQSNCKLCTALNKL